MRRDITRISTIRKDRSQRYQIKNWRDKFSNVPCFILGNGPSLLDHNLSLLDNYLTIGINRCFYVFDPTILMWQDVALWRSEFPKLHNTQSIKVVRDVADPKRLYYNFQLRGGSFQFKHCTHILHGRGSTGPLAVQFAVAMGCSPVVLLGMDCKLGKEGQTDFYGINKHWTNQTLGSCLRGLEFIKNESPVPIINCSNNELWKQDNLFDVMDLFGTEFARGRRWYSGQLLENS